MTAPLPMASTRKHGAGDMTAIDKAIMIEVAREAMLEAMRQHEHETAAPAPAGTLWPLMVKLAALVILLASLVTLSGALGWH